MSFKRLDAEDFVVSADSVQSTAWSTGLATLTSFFTSSTQAAASSGDFYLSIFQTASSNSSAVVQFDVAYANVLGSGSTYYNSNYPQYSPSSTNYGQYRSLVLEDENSSFTFGDGNNQYTSNDFWIISVDRARYKEKLFPGTFSLSISGSGGKVTLTDNSGVQSVATFLGSNRVFQIISGSNGSPVGSTGYVTNSGSYGLYLPDIGTILLNPAAINQSTGLSPNTNANISNTINTTAFVDSLNLGTGFTLNAEETITSDYIFIRSRNSEFNYSTNPSFISGSTGELIFSQFINNPQVYVTTVGMYNDANELVAVAKLSRPLVKDFTKESLIRVKLDF
jgi:hypothetical protein